MLREIEQSLLAEDPKFASSVARDAGFRDAPQTGQLTMRSVALMVLGLVLLIGGVAMASISMWLIAVSVIGFIVMLAGGIMALRAPAAAPSQQRAAAGPQRARSPRSVSMEESFRRRFDNPEP